MEFKELIELLHDKPVTLARIAKLARLTTEETESFLKPYLDRGDIVNVEKNKYQSANGAGIILATVVSIKANSYYAKDLKTGVEYRLAGSYLRGLIVSDQIYLMPIKNSDEATYIGFYRRKERLNGNLYRRPKSGYQLLSTLTKGTNVKIFVKNDPEEIGGVDGDLVSATIIESEPETIRVEVNELLSKATDIGADITAIIAEKEAPLFFSEEAVEEAEKIPQTIDEQALQGRTDYRDRLICTIDGADALDFDDAVEARELTDNCYEVVVHIADVSFYVRPGSAIDTEAENRGTSIYVADRVVPMLPPQLSNGICSLNPDVDRFTLSIEMRIDPRGNVFHSAVRPGVIRSGARLTYSDVNAFLEGKETEEELSDDIKKMLLLLDKISQLIRKRRARQGALDLDSTELKFYLDDKGRPLEVVKRKQGAGEKLIEDLMIIANVEVARKMTEAAIPTLYRIHENPPSAKIAEFRRIATRLKMAADFPARISPLALSNWLSAIVDETERKTVSRLLLRSLAKARYSPDNVGHFGLAETDYLHFTSPIRRYPDLLVHRAVRDYLLKPKKIPSEYYDYMTLEGEQASRAERRAVEIERAVDDLESAKYMSKHLEEYFDAVVTGFANFGIFVELDNGIDATLEFSHMGGDYYIFNEERYEVRGREKNSRITLGQKMRVISLTADVTTRRIEVCDEAYYHTSVESLSQQNLQSLESQGITYREDTGAKEHSRYVGNGFSRERRPYQKTAQGFKSGRRSFDSHRSSDFSKKRTDETEQKRTSRRFDRDRTDHSYRSKSGTGYGDEKKTWSSRPSDRSGSNGQSRNFRRSDSSGYNKSRSDFNRTPRSFGGEKKPWESRSSDKSDHENGHRFSGERRSFRSNRSDSETPKHQSFGRGQSQSYGFKKDYRKADSKRYSNGSDRRVKDGRSSFDKGKTSGRSEHNNKEGYIRHERNRTRGH